MHNEIKLCSKEDNGVILFCHILSKKTKKTLYTTYLRPIVSYVYYTWFRTAGDENKLDVRKVLRKIYGPVYYTDTQM